MEQMIDSQKVKKLRAERAWSQDELATVSGLGLRTVQRIEREGAASIESRRALAAAFGIEARELDIDQAAEAVRAGRRRGQIYGYTGAAIGLLAAYAGITTSLMSGNMSGHEAGLSYGGVGAFFGVCCALIGWLGGCDKADSA